MKKQHFKKAPPTKQLSHGEKHEVRKKEQRVERKFPNIYRFIPEIVTKSGVIVDRKSIIGFISGTILLLIIMQLVDVREHYLELKQVQFDRTHILSESLYWQRIIQKYPTYRDAYFRSALLANSMGEKDQARAFLLKTIELDPTFEMGKLMLKKLGS